MADQAAGILCRAARLIESARRRKESRGLHYTLDYLDKSDDWTHDTIVHLTDGPRV